MFINKIYHYIKKKNWYMHSLSQQSKRCSQERRAVRFVPTWLSQIISPLPHPCCGHTVLEYISPLVPQSEIRTIYMYHVVKISYVPINLKLENEKFVYIYLTVYYFEYFHLINIDYHTSNEIISSYIQSCKSQQNMNNFKFVFWLTMSDVICKLMFFY